MPISKNTSVTRIPIAKRAPATKKVSANIEIITPKRAGELLALNTNNRPLMRGSVRVIADAIVNGEWKLNGESIKISKDNVLLDGQYRLSAIVESGLSCESVVVTNLDDDTFTTIDQGKSRTMSDIISMTGGKNTTLGASISGCYYYYVKSGVPDRDRASNFGVGRPSKMQLLEFYENNPCIANAASFISSRKPLRSLTRASIMGTAYCILSQINSKDCDTFFDALASGLTLNPKYPPLVLREKLLKIPLNGGIKVRPITVHAYIMLAWNAFRDGRDISSLTWVDSVTRVSTFPHPK